MMRFPVRGSGLQYFRFEAPIFFGHRIETCLVRMDVLWKKTRSINDSKTFGHQNFGSSRQSSEHHVSVLSLTSVGLYLP